MNILFLTQIIPYPPDAGPRVKTWHVLRYLASRGHRVWLASFVRPEEEAYLPEVRKICKEVVPVPIQRSRLADIGYWLTSHLTGRPFLVERDDLPEMRAVVEKILSTEKIDVIHADQLTMVQFALPYLSNCQRDERKQKGMKEPVRVVFDAHNATWTIVDRMRENAPWFLKPVAGIEAQRIKRYEGKIVASLDQTLAVTEPDRIALAEAVASVGQEVGSAPVAVIPIAVDTQKLQPLVRKPGSHNIVTLGTLHYPPNADGIRWFLQEVFPKVRAAIPDATLTIIGKNPPADFLERASKERGSIRVTGYLPDLDPTLAEAALMVVAVRAGGGMRVRILEAFARAMPVVTTTVGLEGIEATPGVDVLVEDQADRFAAAVVDLLQDAERQAQLAHNGRRLAETCYDWQVVLQKMDAVYPMGEKGEG